MNKATACELVDGEFLLVQISLILNFLNLKIVPLEDIKKVFNYSSMYKIYVFSKRIYIIIEPM